MRSNPSEEVKTTQLYIWSDIFFFKNRYCLKKLMKLSTLPLAPFIIQLLYQLLIWSKAKFILLNFFMDQLVLLKIWHFNYYPDWFWIFYCPMKSMCIWWLPLVTRVASIFNFSFSKILCTQLFLYSFNFCSNHNFRCCYWWILKTKCQRQVRKEIL